MPNESTNPSSLTTTAMVFNPRDPTTTLLSVNMANITKLTNTNFIMWSRQIKALLEGHELHGFIDNSTTVPEVTIVVDGQTIPNPAFPPWQRMDRLLYIALICVISLPLQSVVTSATMTCEVWDLLTMTFGTPSRGHIHQLRFQLRTCVKGTKMISEYLRLIKSKADDLALLGKPMDPEDLTEQILVGLPEEYKPIVDAINGRDTAVSFSELHEELLNREAMVFCNDTNLSSPAPVTANVASNRPKQSGQNSWRPQQNRNNNPGYYQNNINRSSKQYMGRCQACGVQGHSAK